MGEQLVLPELNEYQPLGDAELQDRIFTLIAIANEVTNSLANPEGLIYESQQELQASLAAADRELDGLLDTATRRGLMGESILEEV